MRLLSIFFIFFFVSAVKNPCDVDTLGSKEWMLFLKKGKYKIIDSAKVTPSSTSRWDPKKYDKLIREDYLGLFTFHTEKQEKPYVILDLKKKQKIGGIMIINRADNGGRRTYNINIELSNDKKKWKNIFFSAYPQDIWEKILEKPETYRYIKVWINKTEYLHLAQILVYVQKK